MENNLARLFEQNYAAVHANIKFKNTSEKQLLALIYTLANEPFNIENFKTAKALLKSQQGRFSRFRVYIENYCSSKLDLSSNPEQYLSELETIYNHMIGFGFKKSFYTVVAAFSIHNEVEASQYQSVIRNGYNLYKQLKSKYGLKIKQSYYIDCINAAINQVDTDYFISKVEELYKSVKKDFVVNAQALQICCNLTVFKIADKYNALNSLYEKFKTSDIKIAKKQMSTLIPLLFVDKSEMQIVKDISAIYKNNSVKKFGVSKEAALALAVALYTGNDQSNLVVSKVVEMLIMQQVMAAVIIANSAAAGASAASS